MKRIILVILPVLLACFLHAQTPGQLTVTTTTSTAGGNFAPKNIVAIWIEDDQGNFVKTLLAYAQTRKTHLNTWEASTTAAGSPFNVVDAITGATRPNHDTRSCTWNGTDVNGNVVADGTYHVWMELTDKNGTGNFSSFSFEKDTATVNLTPLSVPSFSAISIDWEPVFTGIMDSEASNSIRIFPNPTTGILSLQGDPVLKVTVRNASGEIVTVTSQRTIDLTTQPDGVYFLQIQTDRGSLTKKVVKKSF